MFINNIMREFFFRDFIYLSLERRGGREKKRERNISVWLPLASPLLGDQPTTQVCALTGNQTSNPVVCRPALNPQSHTSQGKWNDVGTKHYLRTYWFLGTIEDWKLWVKEATIYLKLQTETRYRDRKKKKTCVLIYLHLLLCLSL